MAAASRAREQRAHVLRGLLRILPSLRTIPTAHLFALASMPRNRSGELDMRVWESRRVLAEVALPAFPSAKALSKLPCCEWRSTSAMTRSAYGAVCGLKRRLRQPLTLNVVTVESHTALGCVCVG